MANSRGAIRLASRDKAAVRGITALRLIDDAGLVSEYLAGESRAFDVLVERYQARLLNFVYRIVGDRERAEDLVQEVFIRVISAISSYERPSISRNTNTSLW